MKKKYICILLFIIFFLNSCTLGGRTMIYSDDDIKADFRLEQILEAIANEDRNAIKAMFSENALYEANDIESGIDYLFSLIEGNIESWDRIGGSVDESNDHGKKTVKSKYRYNVYTDTEQYLFSILEFTIDTNHPENIGVYSLKVINVNNEEPVFLGAGIYIPEETLIKND